MNSFSVDAGFTEIEELPGLIKEFFVRAEAATGR